jgi:hypothetical protein
MTYLLSGPRDGTSFIIFTLHHTVKGAFVDTILSLIHVSTVHANKHGRLILNTIYCHYTKASVLQTQNTNAGLKSFRNFKRTVNITSQNSYLAPCQPARCQYPHFASSACDFLPHNCLFMVDLILILNF